MRGQGNHTRRPRKGLLGLPQRLLGAFLRQPSMRKQAKRLTEFQDALEPACCEQPTFATRNLPPVPYPALREPTEEDITGYVYELTDPDLKLPSFDPPFMSVNDGTQLEETRFDLIRVHPYLKRETSENRGQYGPDSQPASSGSAMDSGHALLAGDPARSAGQGVGPVHSGTRG